MEHAEVVIITGRAEVAAVMRKEAGHAHMAGCDRAAGSGRVHAAMGMPHDNPLGVASPADLELAQEKAPA